MNRLLIVVLITIILVAVGGTLYFLDSEGVLSLSGPLRAMGGRVPVVGQYIEPVARPPVGEIREMERLQEEKARDQRWAAMKKKEEELRRAEGLLNEERARLGQWEGELERRELAINEREKTFTDREKQYERQVRVYLNMRPAVAAKVLSQLEDLEVIEIFRRMPERNMSAILGEMDPSVSSAIMRKMNR